MIFSNIFKSLFIYGPTYFYEMIIKIASIQNGQQMSKYIRTIFTKVPKQIFCTQIPHGHIHLLRWGSPDLNVKVKVRRMSKD